MTSDNVLHLFTHLFKRVERIELDFLIELTTFKYFLTRKQPNLESRTWSFSEHSPSFCRFFQVQIIFLNCEIGIYIDPQNDPQNQQFKG